MRYWWSKRKFFILFLIYLSIVHKSDEKKERYVFLYLIYVFFYFIVDLCVL